MYIKVIIEEHISKEMEIKSNSIEDAMKKAEELYLQGKFAPDVPNIPNFTLMMADDGDVQTDWVEF